jgi:hypothetical protein
MRFEVLMPFTMKIFWEMMLCSLVYWYQCFGATPTLWEEKIKFIIFQNTALHPEAGE